MDNFSLDKTNRFIISNFQQQRPFASFLPGIAGLSGIPMWVFYVNRGQAISSFGVENKDSPLMEYQPANKAYQMIPYTGFRTFIKLTGDNQTTLFEPFSAWGRDNEDPLKLKGQSQRMIISANELEIEEINYSKKLKTSVLYYILPGENFAALVRQVTFQNLAETPVSLEILDGMPVVIPYGVNNSLLKELGRTIEAWMEVFNLDENIPFYRLRASVVDKVDVEIYQAGHFAMAFIDQIPLPALVDPVVVFGTDTGFYQPQGFYRQSLTDLLATSQITCGRTPCGFFAHQSILQPSQSMTLSSLYGHIAGLEILQKLIPVIRQPTYFESKHQEAVSIINDLTKTVETHTSSPAFDGYCRQNFLDNVLRGGWPLILGGGDNPHVFPVYWRKHGDLERDYNDFFIAAEHYSQGEASYRDVNQNRRDNVKIKPRVGDFDIRTFMSLIQIDGYNPRVIKGSTFTLSSQNLAAILTRVEEPEKLRAVLEKPFTPGSLIRYVEDHNLFLNMSGDEFFSLVMKGAEQHIQADFYEGYWIDHWEYNLDLIESYLAVYPDLRDHLLFGQPDLPFYDSPAVVQPRSRKYVLVNGIPKQIGSLCEDSEKAALIASRPESPNWMRTKHGTGRIYHSTLLVKMVLIALLKFSTLDPYGMGIEMEASRPGWYDALNGLPALFGSGMAETYELNRWLIFLIGEIRGHEDHEVLLPVEVANMLNQVIGQLETRDTSTDPLRDYNYWDGVSSAREAYRASTRLGIEGTEVAVSLAEIGAILKAFQAKVTAGITCALELNGGLPPTYFIYRVDEYEVMPAKDSHGHAYIRPRRFTPQVLPLFLEGPVSAFKVLPDVKTARQLYRRVKNSPLFDRKLKMYKVNASLEDQPFGIGRVRAFPPGWLENESIWLHMEYKYMLETLKARLYNEFITDLSNVLIPFLDPQVYGRSILENSSFLVSSAHPDKSLHGTGYVARLSGSTAEFISIWHIMMAGETPFFMRKGRLCLSFKPVLPGWLFPESGDLSFRFLGCCMVTYHNPKRLDTFRGRVRPRQIDIYAPGCRMITIDGDTISSPYAQWVRSGKVERIEVFF